MPPSSKGILWGVVATWAPPNAGFSSSPSENKSSFKIRQRKVTSVHPQLKPSSLIFNAYTRLNTYSKSYTYIRFLMSNQKPTRIEFKSHDVHMKKPCCFLSFGRVLVYVASIWSLGTYTYVGWRRTVLLSVSGALVALKLQSRKSTYECYIHLYGLVILGSRRFSWVGTLGLLATNDGELVGTLLVPTNDHG